VLRAALAAVAAALVVPATAQAALSFAFDRAQARVGRQVHAYQGDAAFYCVPCGSTYFGSAEPHSVWTRKAGRVLKVRR